MICKIFNQGQGLSSPIINYLLSKEKHKGYEPEIVQGNADLTRFIIDGLKFKNKYLTGVLSFKKGEFLNEGQQLELINRFERTFAPFDDPARVNFLWVRHYDKGRLELHFLTPRTDLKSNKSFNLHPPGKANQLFFEAFVRLTNLKYGFNQVDDKVMTPENTRFFKNVYVDLMQKRKLYLFQKFDFSKKIKYAKTKRGATNGQRITRDFAKSTNNPDFSKFPNGIAGKYNGASNANTTARATNADLSKQGNQRVESFSQYACKSVEELFRRNAEAGARGSEQRSTPLTISSALSIDEQLYFLGVALTTASPSEYDAIKARIDYLWGQREHQFRKTPKP